MRRTYAALLCFVWLLGVEVLPNAHLATHSSTDHQHTPNGTIVTVTFDRDGGDTHAHDDGTVHADHAQPEKPAKKKKRSPILAIDRVPDLHVASGLAHRDVALKAAAPPVVDAIAVDRVETDIRHHETGRDEIALFATCDARGPPSA